MKLHNILYSLLLFIAVVFVLIVASDLIIPFVMSLILWFFVKESRSFIRRIKFIRRHIPIWIITMLGICLIGGIFSGAILIVTNNVQELLKSMPVYEANVDRMLSILNNKLEINVIEWTRDRIDEFDLSAILSSIFGTLSDIVGDAFLIFIYLLFLLLEESYFDNKLKSIYPDLNRFRNANRMIKKIDRSISRYLTLKTFVSVLTGILSYIALAILGVEAPAFWAFAIFLMNYIPTIGSIIATTFPAIFAVLQFGDFMPGVWVLITVGAIQMVVGNFIDPKVMGNSLNVSPLVVMLSLSAWGAIWGILGMVLSLPITVMMIITFSEFEQTRSIAVFLTQNGKIEPPQREFTERRIEDKLEQGNS